MRLQVNWQDPIPLRSGARQNLIYTLDIESLPDGPGIYVFGRRFGQGFEALYVGQATNLRHRVNTQLNNLKLMQHVRTAKAGRRVVVVGEFIAGPRQPLEKCLDIVERAFIRHFLADGHDLVNISGTVLRRHEILSSYRPMRFVPPAIYVDR